MAVAARVCARLLLFNWLGATESLLVELVARPLHDNQHPTLLVQGDPPPQCFVAVAARWPVYVPLGYYYY